jgi:hypothetical protein
MVRPYEARLRDSFDATLHEAAEFFMGRGDVRATLRHLTERLAAEGIAYAVVGGMALGEHGYIRMTEDVAVLVTREGLERFRAACVGRGYTPNHTGAVRSFRDTDTGVRIDFVVTGEFPGDGKPKAVSFPEPLACSDDVDGVRVLTLPHLIELKLASAMTAPDRLRDLADVQELIRSEQLDNRFADQLDPSVRSRFVELVAATRRSTDSR